MTKIEQIIGEIEEYIEQSKYSPLSNSKIVLNKDEISEMLVELRMAIPDEIRQCQKMVSNQDAILNAARARADEVMAEANRMQEQMVDQHEIMQKAYATASKLVDDARIQAQEIVENASAEANSIRIGAMQYTDDMLQQLQSIIGHSMEEVQSKFTALDGSLRSTYEIVESNRKELSQGLGNN